MTGKHRVELGDVQQTLFITLAGRAREAKRKRPLLDDPMAARMVESIEFDKMYEAGWGDFVTVLRTSMFDEWVRRFLAENPRGTVVELGAGLNTRFERVDNGTVHWIDVDLPDTIELRKEFFQDTDRRRTIVGSALEDDWYDQVAECPGPYFVVSEGVLVYLPEDGVRKTLSGLKDRFPGVLIAFDSYSEAMLKQQHKTAERRNMPAKWAWGTDDPSTFTKSGLEVVESTKVATPSVALRARLTMGRRVLLKILNPLTQGAGNLTLFKGTAD